MSCNLEAQNKHNVLATTPPAPHTEQPFQLGFEAFGTGNRRKQSNKKFCNYCKCPSHIIETCYRRNKSTTNVANTESTLPMSSISTESQSSRSTINLSSTNYRTLAELNYHLIFYYSRCTVQDLRTGQKLETGLRVGHMFLVDNLHLPSVVLVSVVVAAAAVSSLPSLALWHSRLGHASSSQVQQLASKSLLGSISKDNFDCISCQLGKQPSFHFNNSESISNSIFELIHFDVLGPSPVTSIGGSRYFFVFIDDYSRYSWIFSMKCHSELLPIYSNFAKMVEIQFSKHIRIFRSDNALEYTQYAF